MGGQGLRGAVWLDRGLAGGRGGPDAFLAPNRSLVSPPWGSLCRVGATHRQSCDRSPPATLVMRSGCHRSQEGVCRLCCIWTKPRAPWAAASGAASRLAPRVAHPSGRLVGQAGGWQMFFPGEQAGRCKASPDPSALPRQLMGGSGLEQALQSGELGGLLAQQDPVLGRARDLASKPSSTLINGAA